MQRAELDRTLELNKAYLRGDTSGAKADLRGVSLRGSDLRGVSLQGSDLRGASLRGSDLRGASLRGSDLRGASLRGSDLRWANLREADLSGASLRGAKGFHILTQTDHGYLVTAAWDGRWRIQAGCRDFSIAQARFHWGHPDYPSQATGSLILTTLDWLETQPTPTDEETSKP